MVGIGWLEAPHMGEMSADITFPFNLSFFELNTDQTAELIGRFAGLSHAV
jgi:hypothetical protein